MPPATLPAITALARAGAVERAWALFEEAGYHLASGEPAALAVKGRLLKDRARLAPAGDKAILFAKAASAYGEACLIDPAPYLAINAATARLLSGDQAGATEGAWAVLALLDAAKAPADTPYYLAATRAEALLLLGDEVRAEQALAEAAAQNPDGWDDRAVTLAQLRAIGAAQHRALGWLDRFAPPPSLHFAGHMGLYCDGASERRLRGDLDRVLDEIRPGFAWGALAAGVDLVVAEQLLARGCLVHAVLPCPPGQFETQSVAPAGDSWLVRYRQVLDQVETVQSAGPGASSVHDPIATAHAGELAIGGAILNARRLSSQACQLIICDEDGGGTNTRRQAALWQPQAGRQIRLTAMRDSSVEATFPPEHPDPNRALTVHIAIGIDHDRQTSVVPSDQIVAAQAPMQAALEGLAPSTVRAGPGAWELIFTDVDQALGTVSRVLAATGADGSLASVGVTLAIATLHLDRASNALVPFGPGAALARRLQAMAAPGTALASNALAVAMTARGSSAMRSELYHFGDVELGGAVHTLL